MSSPRAIRFTLATLLATVAALATALVVVANTGPEGDGVVPGSYLPPPAPLPMLTAEQKQQIIDLALSDERVKGLLGSASATPNEPEVWTNSARQLMGGVVTLQLGSPIRASGQ